MADRRFGVGQLVRFAWLETRCCLFALTVFAGLAVTTVVPLPIARYDALLIYCVLVTVAFRVLGLESTREILVICGFHLIGLAFEFVKVPLGSWAYPEPALTKVLGVPLYSGFLYAAVGSYVLAAWRVFALRVSGYRAVATTAVATAIYVNLITHHWLPDLRWPLAALLVLAPLSLFSELKAAIPYVSRVENRRPARGGVDPEELDNARVRGPMLLRTGSRAVTAEDYEHLAQEAAPDVARVRCVAAGAGAEAGGVRVLVVPAVPEDERLRFESLIPPESLVRTIAEHLDRRRVIGARVVVEPPAYQGVTIVAKVQAAPTADPNRVQRESLDALFRYFHPVVGGPNGDGWPFGRQVHQGDVYSVLQRMRGVELVDDVRLFAADPVTGERGKPASRVEIDANALIFSYGHQVLVEGAGGQAR